MLADGRFADVKTTVEAGNPEIQIVFDQEKASQLGLVVPDGDPAKLIVATATLTAMVGALLMLASVLRLGFVATFISTPVLTGFKAGIGLVIVLDQVPKLLGIHIAKQGFFVDVLSVVQHVPATSLLTLAVAFGPYVVFDLLFQETITTRYALPLVVPVGYLAVRGASALPRTLVIISDSFATMFCIACSSIPVSSLESTVIFTIRSPSARLFATARPRSL